jgi:hypothetical protein
MALGELATKLEAASDAIANAGALLNRLDPGARAFGGDVPGRFGELGRQFHNCWTAAIAARTREASDQASRLVDVAESVRQAVSTYHDTEQAERSRHPDGEA